MQQWFWAYVLVVPLPIASNVVVVGGLVVLDREVAVVVVGSVVLGLKVVVVVDR